MSTKLSQSNCHHRILIISLSPQTPHHTTAVTIDSSPYHCCHIRLLTISLSSPTPNHITVITDFYSYHCHHHITVSTDSSPYHCCHNRLLTIHCYNRLLFISLSPLYHCLQLLLTISSLSQRSGNLIISLTPSLTGVHMQPSWCWGQ